MRKKLHHLTEKQIESLEKLSKETGLSVAELIRRAIDEYTEEKVTDELVQRALDEHVEKKGVDKIVHRTIVEVVNGALDEYLKKNGVIDESIRRAIDDYLEKKGGK